MKLLEVEGAPAPLSHSWRRHWIRRRQRQQQLRDMSSTTTKKHWRDAIHDECVKPITSQIWQ